MARKDYFTGKASIIGWALQAEASGTRFGGTPGTLRYNRPVPGGAVFSIGADQTPDETMDVTPQSHTTGATKHTGTMKQFLSYEHQELLHIAMYGGTDTKAGTGPYTHTIELEDDEIYMTLAMYYENYKGVKFLRTYTDALITQITLQFSPEERPTIEVSWVARTVAATTPGATPTLNVMDLVDWKHVTATIDSAVACINSGTFTVVRGADDSDVTMGCDAPEIDTLFNNTQRTAQLSTELGIDDTLETILAATTTGVTGSLVCDNGLLTTANRKIEFTFTALLATTLSTTPATRGKRKETVNWVVSGWDGVVITNSLTDAQV